MRKRLDHFVRLTGQILSRGMRDLPSLKKGRCREGTGLEERERRITPYYSDSHPIRLVPPDQMITSAT